MTQKEDIKKIHEMIREIASSTSIGDFGLKEQLCIELLKWKEQQMIEKACEWLERNADKYIVSYGFPTYQTGLLIMEFKKAMEE